LIFSINKLLLLTRTTTINYKNSSSQKLESSSQKLEHWFTTNL